MIVLPSVTVELLPPQPIVLFVDIAVIVAVGTTVFWYTVNTLAGFVDDVVQPDAASTTVNVYTSGALKVAFDVLVNVPVLDVQVKVALLGRTVGVTTIEVVKHVNVPSLAVAVVNVIVGVAVF